MIAAVISALLLTLPILGIELPTREGRAGDMPGCHFGVTTFSVGLPPEACRAIQSGGECTVGSISQLPLRGQYSAWEPRSTTNGQRCSHGALTYYWPDGGYQLK